MKRETLVGILAVVMLVAIFGAVYAIAVSDSRVVSAGNGYEVQAAWTYQGEAWVIKILDPVQNVVCYVPAKGSGIACYTAVKNE